MFRSHLEPRCARCTVSSKCAQKRGHSRAIARRPAVKANGRHIGRFPPLLPPIHKPLPDRPKGASYFLVMTDVLSFSVSSLGGTCLVHLMVLVPVVQSCLGRNSSHAFVDCQSLWVWKAFLRAAVAAGCDTFVCARGFFKLVLVFLCGTCLLFQTFIVLTGIEQYRCSWCHCMRARSQQWLHHLGTQYTSVGTAAHFLEHTFPRRLGAWCGVMYVVLRSVGLQCGTLDCAPVMCGMLLVPSRRARRLTRCWFARPLSKLPFAVFNSCYSYRDAARTLFCVTTLCLRRSRS